MIEIYTRKQCGKCQSFKNSMKFHDVSYTEHVIDETIEREEVLEKFPGASSLPIVVVNGIQMSYPDATKQLNEYKENFGKTLLNE